MQNTFQRSATMKRLVHTRTACANVLCTRLAVSAACVFLVLGCNGGRAPSGDGQVDSGITDGSVDSGCATALDQDTVDRLTLTYFTGVVQLQPGDSHDFQVGVVECCYFFVPQDTCVSWSHTPEDGASITPGGRFTVSSETPHGVTYTVTANVESGRRLVSTQVFVYTSAANPLVGGSFYEIAQIECGSEALREPEEPIGELLFLASGDFLVTWMPFEIYVDYWGLYAYDLETEAIGFTLVGSGNYVPPDLDLEGSFTFDATGNLVLRDLWLGTPSGGQAPPSCGHVFAR